LFSLFLAAVVASVSTSMVLDLIDESFRHPDDYCT
jgi:hypothetical protein